MLLADGKYIGRLCGYWRDNNDVDDSTGGDSVVGYFVGSSYRLDFSANELCDY